MNTVSLSIVVLFGVASTLASPPVSAQEEDDEEATDLQSYSVGAQRPSMKSDKVTIERPTFKNTFKVEMQKPSLSGLKIAKPKLEVLSGPERSEEAAKRTASTDGGTSTAGTGATASTAPGGETRAVQPLLMAAPEYPREAYRRRQEGYVVVEFTINVQGGTEDIEVVEAQPRGAFETEARRAVGRWTFEPALRDGRPVPQRIRHTLEFKLQP